MSLIKIRRAFPSGRAFATRFPAKKAGRAQTMAQSLTQIRQCELEQELDLRLFTSVDA